MEGARDLALEMQSRDEGIVLDQFNNFDNPNTHYHSTGPEIWKDTEGEVTHFVSAMGTTGTIMGVSHYLKDKNSEIRVIGVQPTEGSRIPGIRPDLINGERTAAGWGRRHPVGRDCLSGPH